MELEAAPLFVRASELSKQLSSCGYQAKIRDRESAEVQMCRVLAQGVAAQAGGGGLHKELPCQKLLEKVGTKKCKKAKFKDHIRCPVICPLCPQAVGPPVGPGSPVFGTGYSFAGHMLSKHKIPPTAVSFGGLPCNCCGYYFANNKSLCHWDQLFNL